MTRLNEHASPDDLAKLLVGNKSDLEASREVSKEKAQQFCQEFGMEMLETSAKSGENVLQAFDKLIAIVHERELAAFKSKGGHAGAVKLDGEGKDGATAVLAAASCGC
jgi:GTPase SAR1 family protein